MISTYLSGGKVQASQRLVEKKKISLQVEAFNISNEDYSTYVILSLPIGKTKIKTLIEEIDKEIDKIQSELISENDFQKLNNQFESSFIRSNSKVEGIANSLAEYYTFYGDTDLINKELDLYKSITKEEIKSVARLYLNPNQRLELYYLPENEKNNNNEGF